mmetsp:Transcript_23693/g.46198  ORF Transcript_23693/g.46198 Transcript_23693/m.46198 type:complete len:382 (+) Transcript_23693:38-1183(+)
MLLPGRYATPSSSSPPPSASAASSSQANTNDYKSNTDDVAADDTQAKSPQQPAGAPDNAFGDKMGNTNEGNINYSAGEGNPPPYGDEEDGNVDRKEGDPEAFAKLEEQYAHLEERNRITLRQVNTRIQQLEHAVECQGQHLAAKEAVLSAEREKMKKLEAEVKIQREVVERRQHEVTYLATYWQQQHTRQLNRMDWVKAELEELQRHLSRSPAEADARLKKIKGAEEALLTIRPSLGISVSKTPHKRGLVIKDVKEGGLLYDQGVRKDHIIQYINHREVTNADVVEDLMNKAKPYDYFSMLISGNGQTYNVCFEVPFMTKERKQLPVRRTRDMWRVWLGLVRMQDLDLPPSTGLTNRGIRGQPTLKPRERTKRIPGSRQKF